jgi:hypothetical protein
MLSPINDRGREWEFQLWSLRQHEIGCAFQHFCAQHVLIIFHNSQSLNKEPPCIIHPVNNETSACCIRIRASLHHPRRSLHQVKFIVFSIGIIFIFKLALYLLFFISYGPLMLLMHSHTSLTSIVILPSLSNTNHVSCPTSVASALLRL